MKKEVILMNLIAILIILIVENLLTFQKIYPMISVMKI